MWLNPIVNHLLNTVFIYILKFDIFNCQMRITFGLWEHMIFSHHVDLILIKYEKYMYAIQRLLRNTFIKSKKNIWQSLHYLHFLQYLYCLHGLHCWYCLQCPHCVHFIDLFVYQTYLYLLLLNHLGNLVPMLLPTDQD